MVIYLSTFKNDILVSAEDKYFKKYINVYYVLLKYEFIMR